MFRDIFIGDNLERCKTIICRTDLQCQSSPQAFQHVAIYICAISWETMPSFLYTSSHLSHFTCRINQLSADCRFLAVSKSATNVHMYLLSATGRGVAAGGERDNFDAVNSVIKMNIFPVDIIIHLENTLTNQGQLSQIPHAI